MKIHLPPSNKDKLESLREHWEGCTRCPLGERCKHYVLWEVPESGHIDVLFIGEGPGEVEDLLGKPFRGPSGNWLRERINDAGPAGLEIGFINLVACRAQDRFASKYNRSPEDSEVRACRPRLLDFMHIFEPIGMIPLGRIAEVNIDLMRERGQIPLIPIRCLYHPSHMIRPGAKETPEEYIEKLADMFHLCRGIKMSDKFDTSPYESYKDVSQKAHGSANG